jgi:hypothetical protein
MIKIVLAQQIVDELKALGFQQVIDPRDTRYACPDPGWLGQFGDYCRLNQPAKPSSGETGDCDDAAFWAVVEAGKSARKSTSPSFQSAMRMIGMERKTDLMEFQLRHVMRPTWCDVPTIPGFSLSRRKGCLRLAVTLLILGVLGIACLFCLSGCRSGPPPMF